MFFRKNINFRLILALFLLIPSVLLASQKEYYIQTFDSGFGGFFTAKAIEEKAKEVVKDYDVSFKISHLGDTKNAPYGEKEPEAIGFFTAFNLSDIFQAGTPDMTFVACNTASTRRNQANSIIDSMYGDSKSKSISYVISASTNRVKNLLKPVLSKQNVANISIISTPATLKSKAYPEALAKLYGGKLTSQKITKIVQDRWYKKNTKENITSLTRVSTIEFGNKKIFIYQLAPANWVDLIEHGASKKVKEEIVFRDLNLLKSIIPAGTKIDVFGEFCTHYPVVDSIIKNDTKGVKTDKTQYILQGPLMANLFLERLKPEIQQYKRQTPLTDGDELQKLYKELKPSIVVTGDNVKETRELVNTIFHDNNQTKIVSSNP
ncbi:hypothetical protein FLM55_01925 [Francisella sp. Scap27]|uniref:hypothetical protein n=1 Tax=Francisella sp. Scap27 TaxID=2589986 RepID=UPI0015BB36F7|nr:hypothetical protein [Francisella sp. Scap27]QLE78563.1 hypothetical protein FLM55_01925 [Francisella sp. Scap27]